MKRELIVETEQTENKADWDSFIGLMVDKFLEYAKEQEDEIEF